MENTGVEAEQLKEHIAQSLQNIRPYLQIDGGDVELVEVMHDGIVKVRLTGACKECPMSMMTLRAGIERALMREIHQVRRVEAVVG
ncbi:MAG: NifU family protein [Bacteroidota bacterium]|nr:NifU family protein [Bacteroidota bacterium]